MNAVRPLYALLASFRIAFFLRKRPDTATRLAFLLAFKGHLDCAIRILQADTEIVALCDLLAADPPRSMLEIGTAGGGTLFLFAGVSADDAVLISVDLPPPAGYRRHRERIYRAFARGRQQIHLVRADSHDSSTVAKVQEKLAGRPLDFLFIDGNHTGTSPERDYALYAPLVRHGGIIAFHDIVPGEYAGRVPEYWQSLKANVDADVTEFVQNPELENFGIGVLRSRAG